MLIYTYDNTLEGFLSCVFEAYSSGEQPEDICFESTMQYRINQELKPIETIDEHWKRVLSGIQRKLGRMTWTKVRCCYCASTPDKEMQLYRYIRHGFDKGSNALNKLSHPDVLAIENLYRNVGMEQQRMIMFARFAKIPEGVYCATINPKHNVLPLIMSHFANRFNVQPFIIYDEVHQIAGISENGQWYLSKADGLTLPNTDTDDEIYQDLWKSFYDAICIPERLNEKRRMGFMPKRLWKHLPEMHPKKQTKTITPKI